MGRGWIRGEEQRRVALGQQAGGCQMGFWLLRMLAKLLRRPDRGRWHRGVGLFQGSAYRCRVPAPVEAVPHTGKEAQSLILGLSVHTGQQELAGERKGQRGKRGENA